jgi:hypothetical protein
MPERPTKKLTRNVLPEYDYIEGVKEEKVKIMRRSIIFIIFSMIACAAMFGIFYPEMKHSGNNARRYERNN